MMINDRIYAMLNRCPSVKLLYYLLTEGKTPVRIGSGRTYLERQMQLGQPRVADRHNTSRGIVSFGIWGGVSRDCELQSGLWIDLDRVGHRLGHG